MGTQRALSIFVIDAPSSSYQPVELEVVVSRAAGSQRGRVNATAMVTAPVDIEDVAPSVAKGKFAADILWHAV